MPDLDSTFGFKYFKERFAELSVCTHNDFVIEISIYSTYKFYVQ